jgi:hypothetical protein
MFIHSYINTFTYSYTHTFIHSYIHAYTTYTQSYSYMIASVTQSHVRPYLFSSVFIYHCVKPQVSTNEHLTFTFLSSKVSSRCVWSRDVTHYEPGGSRQTLTWPGGFRQTFLSKARWILANFCQKSSGFSQTVTRPSGFSQRFTKAE